MYYRYVAVQVMVRIRPANRREIALVGKASCLSPRGVTGITARADGRACDFIFDHVIGSDSSQEDVFSRALPCVVSAEMSLGRRLGFACREHQQPCTLPGNL